MSTTPQGAGIFLRMPDRVRGPFGTEMLKELIETGVISEATVVGDSEAGPWTTLGRHGLAAELFQPKSAFRLKATEFHRANTASAPPMDHQEMIRMANQGSVGPKKGAAPAPRPINDVEAMVRSTAAANVAREAPMIFVPRKNRRRRDFLFLILVGDGIGALLLYTFRHYPLPLIGVASFMGLYTGAVTWIVWSVMGRY